jgi:hypothetical protein
MAMRWSHTRAGLITAVTTAALLGLVVGFASGKGAIPSIQDWQTLVGVLVAIGVAWLTISAGRNATEQARRDQADARLNQYAILVRRTMEAYERAMSRLMNAEPDSRDSEVSTQRRANEAIALARSADASAALVDGILGGDQQFFAGFFDSVVIAASRRALGESDDWRSEIVFPLFMAITNSIVRRKAMLHDGAHIAELYVLTTVDADEWQAAFLERRAPRFQSRKEGPRQHSKSK